MTFLLGTAAGLALIMSAGYRRTRFFSFLHPWDDPRNTGYQIVQSLMAFGSGHWVGVGLGASRQKWMYVPNAHTDFIFSILGEETGLIGEIIVIALFVVLVYAGIRIAVRAPDLVRAAAGRRHHGLDRVPGRREHGLGDGPAADHRGARSRSCRTAARRWWSPWPRSASCCRWAARRSAAAGARARPRARARQSAASRQATT